MSAAQKDNRISALVPLVVGIIILVLLLRAFFGSIRDLIPSFGDAEGPDTDTFSLGLDDDTETTILQPDSPEAAAMLTPFDPECPEEGNQERHLVWTEAPPMCIDPESDYTATLVTSRGDIVIDLDTENAPETVNNFVFLAGWRYYDSTDVHLVIPDSSVQIGLPLGWDYDDEAPGYTIDDELPDASEEEPLYPQYTVTMGNRGEPDTAGAVFVIQTGVNQRIDRVYSRFGTIEDEESQRVVDEIDATGVRREGDDGRPRVDTLIHTVIIEETSADEPSGEDSD